MSTNNRQTPEQAYILHNRPYRNTSLIVDVFTLENGRFNLLAKAARTPQSPFYGVLQPFVPLVIHYGGKGELPVLYKAEAGNLNNGLQAEQLFNGFYLNELLVRLLHKHDAHPDLFHYYAQALQELASQSMPDVTLRYFELQLLEELGYGLNLDYDTHQQSQVKADQDYHYIIEHGPVAAGIDTQNNLLVRGDTLLQLANRQLHTPAQRQQAKLLMRTVMDYYLGQQPLKARELYRKFRA